MKRRVLIVSVLVAIVVVLILFFLKQIEFGRDEEIKYDYERYYAYCLKKAVTEQDFIPKVTAYSACMTDSRDGHILFEKNCEVKLPNASTTKMITALTALKYMDLNTEVSVSRNASLAPKVKLGIKEGEHYYFKDLLYSMLMASHNDSAVAIAEAICESSDEFAALMNETAYELEAYNSSFVTPNGLDAENHFSTALDLCKIGAAFMDNMFLSEIAQTREYSFNEIYSGKSYSIRNINSFLDMIDGASGIKTGYTGKAGYCFVGAIETEKTRLVSSVLASGWPPNKTIKWEDTKIIYKYVTDTYSEICLECPIIDINSIWGLNSLLYCESFSYELMYGKNETITEVVKISPFEGKASVADGEYYTECYIMYGNVMQQLNCLRKLVG